MFRLHANDRQKKTTTKKLSSLRHSQQTNERANQALARVSSARRTRDRADTTPSLHWRAASRNTPSRTRAGTGSSCARRPALCDEVVYYDPQVGPPASILCFDSRSVQTGQSKLADGLSTNSISSCLTTNTTGADDAAAVDDDDDDEAAVAAEAILFCSLRDVVALVRDLVVCDGGVVVSVVASPGRPSHCYAQVGEFDRRQRQLGRWPWRVVDRLQRVEQQQLERGEQCEQRCWQCVVDTRRRKAKGLLRSSCSHS